MKVTLIQCASGRFVDLQLKTAPHHADYCNKHGYNYSLHLGVVQTRFDPTWDKVYLVRDALEHSSLVVWMDSDSLIVDKEAPLTDALKEFNYIGACKHPEPWQHLNYHYNCGVLFFTSLPETRELLDRCLRIGVVPHASWKVQATILAANQAMGNIISQIDDQWNSTVETNVSPAPVIESWHGHNQDFAPILKRLKEIK